MSNDDLTYYRDRAETEIELATRATHPDAAAAHTQLAAAYLERVGTAGDRMQPDHV